MASMKAGSRGTQQRVNRVYSRVYGTPTEAFTSMKRSSSRRERAGPSPSPATLLQLGSHVGILSEAEKG
ncbi:unnamed protein product [Arctogadus glacialis]